MASIDAPTTIIDPNAVDTRSTTGGREVATEMSVATGQAIEEAREQGKMLEATTPGTFVMPEGDKVYSTFLDMLRDQPQLPDPVFREEDVRPTMEDKGVPLGELDEMDIEFKKMYEEMFSRTSELGVMGAGDFEQRLRKRKNELSESKVENPNGGSIGILSTGGPSVYPSQRPSTPFCYTVQIPVAGPFPPPPTEGGNASDTKDHDGEPGAPVDA